MSCTSGWACGNVAISPADLAMYTYHLFGQTPPFGPVVADPDLRAQMTSPWRPMCLDSNPIYPCTPKMGYGLGVMLGPPGALGYSWGGPIGSPCVFNATLPDNTTVPMDCTNYGHGGEEYGYLGSAYFFPQYDVAVSIGTNVETYAFDTLWRTSDTSHAVQAAVLTALAHDAHRSGQKV